MRLLLALTRLEAALRPLFFFFSSLSLFILFIPVTLVFCIDYKPNHHCFRLHFLCPYFIFAFVCIFTPQSLSPSPPLPPEWDFLTTSKKEVRFHCRPRNLRSAKLSRPDRLLLRNPRRKALEFRLRPTVVRHETRRANRPPETIRTSAYRNHDREHRCETGRDRHRNCD